jgi:hypothetical protein
VSIYNGAWFYYVPLFYLRRLIFVNVKEMSLKDTVELMNSSDFKDRFKAEYYQTKIRAEKLKAMLMKYESGILDFQPKCSYELLSLQLVHMEEYLADLEMRAEIEDVVL